jgi:hypothetical protein
MNNFFYGLEGNKLYKIYVGDMAFNAARIASGPYNEQTARARYSATGGLLGALIGMLVAKMVIKKILAKRAELEAKYDAMAPGSPPFREADKSNFVINASDVLGAIIWPKPSGIKGAFWQGPVLEFSLGTGKKRKFILVENQNLEFIKNLVAGVVTNTRLEG